MITGVGQKLESNSQMFSYDSVGGARIEDMDKKLIGDDAVQFNEDSHIVVMVGTNNLSRDGTVVIKKKYEGMLKTMSELKCRQRSIVGILRRARDGSYLNSKRLAVNENLKEMCKNLDVKYIDPEYVYTFVEQSKFRMSDDAELGILNSGGLHLNTWGQTEVAAALFKHCVGFLG